MPDFAEKPYDGDHPLVEDGGDWRSGGGLGGVLERAVSYGNFGGPGNRILTENPDYVAQQRAANPNYDETTDPKFAGDPRYQPIDGIDAAAEKHDGAYDAASQGNSMFSWAGMHDFRAADKTLVSDVGNEMSANGDKYSGEAKTYADTLQGFFGGREMGMEAVDWAESKGAAVENGLSQAVGGAEKWSSLDDAGKGLAADASGALGFAEESGAEAWKGIDGAAEKVSQLGLAGAAGTIGGLGNVAVAGGISAAEGAWDGLKSFGAGLVGP